MNRKFKNGGPVETDKTLPDFRIGDDVHFTKSYQPVFGKIVGYVPRGESLRAKIHSEMGPDAAEKLAWNQTVDISTRYHGRYVVLCADGIIRIPNPYSIFRIAKAS